MRTVRGRDLPHTVRIVCLKTCHCKHYTGFKFWTD